MTEPLWSDEDRPRLAPTGPVKVRVPAKVNLFLGVGPARPDGYHELHTVYQAIGLYDELSARPADSLALTMDGEGAGTLALDETNLIVKAVRLLSSVTGRPPHARLHLRKHIPIAAGLAGGSADAAAALVACDALWATGLGREELARLAAALGSDVPFLVLGGTALGTGRGELVSPVLAAPHNWHWVVAIADGGLSTPDVYRELDRMRGSGRAPEPLGSTDAILAALRQRDASVLGAALGNDLQPAALSMRPELGAVLATGREAGAIAGLVSGSGPTCVFLAKDGNNARTLADHLEKSELCRAVQTATGPVAGARVI